MHRVSAILLTCLPLVAQFPDAHPVPPGWTGHVFKLSQSYPATLPAPETLPWATIDFKTKSLDYVMAVYKYALDGNTDPAVNWDVQNNPVRKWYHAPNMHQGGSGREFIHGLTKERLTPAKTLAPTQTTKVTTWAVGMYNPRGGFELGHVWANPASPDFSAVSFPEGSVSIKLLFTTATVAQVPYLKNTFTFLADVNRPSGPPQDVRLLQIDLAVRDTRADATSGWVFGTMIYDSEAPGATPWDRMVPIGIMWGNDPGVTPGMVASGTKLQETFINPAVRIKQHLGWAGRLNGPVDNPISSCLSCHSNAAVPNRTPVPPTTGPDSAKLDWFRNIKAPATLDPGTKSLDYSLQLQVGIANKIGTQHVAAPVHGMTAGGLHRLSIEPVNRDGTKTPVPRARSAGANK